LTVNDVIKDYDAVMSSLNHLQGIFGPNSTWPEADLTLEQDLIDLGWHQKEFQIRSSFAYTVVSPDETRVLGCLYIFPVAIRTSMRKSPCGYVRMCWTWVMTRCSLTP